MKEMAGEAARPSWGGRCKRQDARSRLVPPVFALHVCAHKVWTPCRAGHNFLLVIQARFYSENQNSSEMGMPVGPAVAFDYSQPPSCRGKIPPEPPEAACVPWAGFGGAEGKGKAFLPLSLEPLFHRWASASVSAAALMSAGRWRQDWLATCHRGERA